MKKVRRRGSPTFSPYKNQIETMQALNQRAAAWVLGISRESVAQDDSVPRNADGSYDVRKLLSWKLGTLGSTSPLERMRIAKAELEEIKVLERKKVLVPIVDVIEGMSARISELKSVGEEIQRISPEASKMLQDAINRVIERLGDN